MIVYTIILYIHRAHKKQTKLVNRTHFTGGVAVEIYIEFGGGSSIVGCAQRIHNTNNIIYIYIYISNCKRVCIDPFVCVCVFVHLLIREKEKPEERKKMNKRTSLYNNVYTFITSIIRVYVYIIYINVYTRLRVYLY